MPIDIRESELTVAPEKLLDTSLRWYDGGGEQLVPPLSGETEITRILLSQTLLHSNRSHLSTGLK